MTNTSFTPHLYLARHSRTFSRASDSTTEQQLRVTNVLIFFSTLFHFNLGCIFQADITVNRAESCPNGAGNKGCQSAEKENSSAKSKLKLVTFAGDNVDAVLDYVKNNIIINSGQEVKDKLGQGHHRTRNSRCCARATGVGCVLNRAYLESSLDGIEYD